MTKDISWMKEYDEGKLDVADVLRLLIKSKDINPQHKGAVLQHYNYEDKYIISFCVEDINRYPSFVLPQSDWIEDLEISKHCDVVELLQNIDYSFSRYKNTIDNKDNNLKISINFGDSHGTGFDMELKNNEGLDA